MKPKLSVLLLVVVLVALAVMPSAAAPLVTPCAPGAAYDPACDANQDGVVNVLDIQLTAGHWNQSGTWVSDNSHNHLGQMWTGANNPLKIEGSFGSPDYAPLVLRNSAAHGVRVDSAGYTGVKVDSAGQYGVYVGSAGGDGVLVDSAGGNGVSVDSADYDGVYVYSAGFDGVDATSTGASSYGGRLVNSAPGGGGVYARGGGNSAPDLILGGISDSDDDGRLYSERSLTGSDLLFFSNDHAHIHLDEDNNSASNFTIYSGSNTNLWSVAESGMAVAAGPSAVQVDAGKEGQRLTCAVTSPQNWIEDFGSGQLQDGEAVIGLEHAYAESLSTEQPYHVFLTPLADCALYVADKTATSFIVRAIGGQKCTIAFDYRVVGLRRGYEAVRMEQVAEMSDE